MLCDAGYPGQETLILQGLRALGVDPGRLDFLFVTHHDHDHVGSLAALKTTLGRAHVVTTEGEAPFGGPRPRAQSPSGRRGTIAQPGQPRYAFSLERCVSSLVSLRDLDVRTVLCYHGGWFHGDFASERERLIKRYSNGLENSTLLQ